MALRRPWRAADEHTGIGVVDGIPYTYQHLAGRQLPIPAKAEYYRVEGVTLYEAPTPFHMNVYYVPGDRLDQFFDSWGEHAENVIDVRPLTHAEVRAELDAFRKAHS